MPKVDPLVRELTAILRPLLGPASEKADLLTEHLRAQHGLPAGPPPKGIADAARRLRRHLSAAQIKAGAHDLVDGLKTLYSSRETVV